MGYIHIFILFALGMAMIIKGADWFVDSAVWMAETSGVPKIVIGATIVSFATTLPELVVSSFASWDGHPGVAIGDSVGSTICNIGLILGSAAFIRPFKVELKSFIYKSSIMLISGGVLFLFLCDHIVSTAEGLILLLLFVVYVVLNFIEVKAITSKSEPVKMIKKSQKLHRKTWVKIIKFIIGAMCVIAGAELVVDKGVIIASVLGVPERVISLTLIALGTSLPEFITSITSVIKREQSISVGNIIGANILDLLYVTGTAAVINPLKVMHHAAIFDMPVSLFIMALLMITGITDGMIERWEGAILLLCYFLYVSILCVLFFD